MTQKMATILARQKSKWTKVKVQHVEILVPLKHKILSQNATEDEDANQDDDSDSTDSESIGIESMRKGVLSELCLKNGFDLDIRRVEPSKMLTTPGFIIAKMDKRFWSRF